MILNEWILNAERSTLDFIKKYDKDYEAPLSDITHLPFIDIKDTIPTMLNDGKFDECIALVLNESTKNTLKRKEIDRFRILVWIEKQLRMINELEIKYLERPPDFKMLAAGIKNLNVLGYKNTLDTLSNGDITKWSEISKMPYSTCFDKQLKSAIESDIQKKIIEYNKNEQKK